MVLLTLSLLSLLHLFPVETAAVVASELINNTTLTSTRRRPAAISSTFPAPEYADHIFTRLEEEHRQLKNRKRASTGSEPQQRQDNHHDGEQCLSTEDCAEGLECATLSSASTTASRRCMARKDCLKFELSDFDRSFSIQDYKEMILQEAGITEQDLWDARLQYKDDAEFARSNAVQLFLETIQQHKEELEMLAEIITNCGEGGLIGAAVVGGAALVGTGIGATVGAGVFVGAVFAAALSIFFGKDASPSASPSIAVPVIQRPQQQQPEQEQTTPEPTPAPSAAPSEAPTGVPSASPTFGLRQRTYVGFHMEGGLLVDGSYSLFTRISSDVTWGRGCIGVEAGAGGEISLLILIANNREQDDIIGGSVLADLDVGVGAAVGAGAGLYVNGDATSDSPLFYEITLGGGIGIGLGGLSICRTIQI